MTSRFIQNSVKDPSPRYSEPQTFTTITSKNLISHRLENPNPKKKSRALPKDANIEVRRAYGIVTSGQAPNLFIDTQTQTAVTFGIDIQRTFNVFNETPKSLARKNYSELTATTKNLLLGAIPTLVLFPCQIQIESQYSCFTEKSITDTETNTLAAANLGISFYENWFTSTNSPTNRRHNRGFLTLPVSIKLMEKRDRDGYHRVFGLQPPKKGQEIKSTLLSGFFEKFPDKPKNFEIDPWQIEKVWATELNNINYYYVTPKIILGSDRTEQDFDFVTDLKEDFKTGETYFEGRELRLNGWVYSRNPKVMLDTNFPGVTISSRFYKKIKTQIEKMDSFGNIKFEKYKESSDVYFISFDYEIAPKFEVVLDGYKMVIDMNDTAHSFTKSENGRVITHFMVRTLDYPEEVKEGWDRERIRLGYLIIARYNYMFWLTTGRLGLTKMHNQA